MLYLVNIPGFGVQIGHLQDALQELRDSVKVSLQQAAGEREQYEAQANAKAAADKTLYEVCSPVLALALLFQHELRTPQLDTLCVCLPYLGSTVEMAASCNQCTCHNGDMLHTQHAACSARWFGKSHTIHALWQRGIACAPGKGHPLAAYTDSATRGLP